MRVVSVLSLCLLVVAATGCRDNSQTNAVAPSQGAQSQDQQAPHHKEAPKTLVLSKAAVPSSVELSQEILRHTLNATVSNRIRFNTLPLYRLSLDLDYDLFTFSAKSALTYTNREQDTLTELVFLVYPNSEDLTEKGTQNLVIKKLLVNGTEAAFKLEGSVLRVPLKEALKPGRKVQVDMDFKGLIIRLEEGADDLQKLAMQQLIQMVMGDGAKKGGYGVFSVAKGIVSLGLWYPVLAAYDAGGWDLEPGSSLGDVSYFDVANYDVSVSAPDDVVVVTTGTETSRVVENSRRQTRFYAGAVREFTIQMSRHYRSASAVVDGVKISSWFLAGHSNSGRDVLRYAKGALKLFNREFGPYPYTELDVVEAPLVGGAGGVEFPGLVTVASMFYGSDKVDPNADPMKAAMAQNPFIKETLEFVVAHEVAHEWWNAVVGSDSKRHPFVDEALANHSAIHYFRRVHGPKAAEKQIELQLKLPYQIAMMTGSKDRPVDLATKEFSSAMEYAAIVYGKGALFFDAMLRRFGETSHFAFFRNYYREHAFGIATTEDLVGGLIRNSPDPAAAQMLADRWLKGVHGQEDVGPIKIGAVLKHLLGPDMFRGPARQVVELLDHKGSKELAKLIGKMVSPDGSVSGDIDYGSIVRLAGEMLSGEDKEWGSVIEKLGSFLTRNPGLLGGKEMDGRQLLNELGKVVVGNDPKARAILDATDAVLRLLSDEVARPGQ